MFIRHEDRLEYNIKIQTNRQTDRYIEYKYRNIKYTNIDLNYDLSDSEIKQAKEEDTSNDLFD